MPATLAPDDLKKSFVNAMSHPSEDIARTILAQAGVDPDRLEKTISTATGLVAFDLQAPAKNLYPAATPLRNRGRIEVLGRGLKVESDEAGGGGDGLLQPVRVDAGLGEDGARDVLGGVGHGVDERLLQ